ncbi:MAG: hypothetical protein EAZ47_06045 [Bacteroidetes bacterium]|nr:MAG: hypothetical protein EAZ47_06045 [Bacteroidota bacterium]
MQTLQGTYFDGKTAQAHAVNVTIQSDFLTIHFVNSTASSGQSMLLWNANQVQLKETTTQQWEISFEGATILVADAQLQNILSTYWGQNHPALRQKNLFNYLRNRVVALCLIATGILAIGYFFILPLLCDVVAENMPYSYEKQLGETVFNSMVNTADVDSTRSAQLQQFANGIQFGNKHPLTFYVVNDDVYNAFALPGGHVVVYNKLLNQMPTKEALAALLAHEVAHQKNKHALKSMVRGIANYAFIAILTNDVNGITALLIQSGGNLKQMKFSRNLETEADDDGLDILKNNQLSQKGFEQLFDVLGVAEEEYPASTFPEMLSTHPLTKKRLNKAVETAKKQTQILPHYQLEKHFEALMAGVKQQ